MNYAKPLPKVNHESRAFWEASKEHRLVLPRCKACGHVWFPPYAYCPKCISPDVEWIDASGKGKVWGWLEMHQAYMPSFQDDLPYNVVLVLLDEGAFMFGNVVDVAFEDLKKDLPVEVVFEDVSDEVALPKFRVAGS